MAEEAEQEQSGGGGIVKLLILVIPALLVGLGGGYFIGKSLTETAMKEEQIKEPKEEEAKVKEPSVGPMFKLDAFTVNLHEPRGNRYLKTTIQLELDSDLLKPEVEKRLPQIQDIVLALLTSKTTEELQSLEGKFRLREELLSRINALLVNGKLKRVYFTEFVIQ